MSLMPLGTCVTHRTKPLYGKIHSRWHIGGNRFYVVRWANGQNPFSPADEDELVQDIEGQCVS